MKVLVIDAIGLRPSYLGCYGNDWVITPQLDQFACDSVVFDRHYGDFPTIRLRAGDWLQHGRYRILGAPNTKADFGDNELTLIEPQANEFVNETVSAVSSIMKQDNAIVCATWSALLAPWQIPTTYIEDYFADDSIEPWLDPPAGPYPKDDWQSLQFTYAAAVTFFDEQFGELRNELLENEWFDELMICVTAQSGFALGEHGYIGEHRAWQHDEIVHVPLLCRLPNRQQAGRRILSVTQTVDLAATIHKAVGVKCETSHGIDMSSLLYGETDNVRECAVSGLQVGESVEWALRTAEWAYLLPRQYPPNDPERREQLYAKPEDRYEVNNLMQQHLDYVDDLRKALCEFAERTKSPGPIEMPALPT